jgi:hypothetical protein
LFRPEIPWTLAAKGATPTPNIQTPSFDAHFTLAHVMANRKILPEAHDGLEQCEPAALLPTQKLVGRDFGEPQVCQKTAFRDVSLVYNAAPVEAQTVKLREGIGSYTYGLGFDMAFPL